MATSFPGGLDSFVDPAPTDDMSVVSHSLQHTSANDAIAALEAKVGVNGSAVTTSLDYKINHLPAGGDYSGLYYPQAVAVSNFPRISATSTQGGSLTGSLGLYTGFIAPASIVANQMTVYVTQAGTSISSCVAALFTVASNGDLTRVAVSAANTTWLGTLGKRTLAFATPVTLVAGNAYAACVFANIGGTQCNIAGPPGVVNTAISSGILQPFVAAFNTVTPAATVTFASLTANSGVTSTPYVEIN